MLVSKKNDENIVSSKYIEEFYRHLIKTHFFSSNELKEREKKVFRRGEKINLSMAQFFLLCEWQMAFRIANKCKSKKKINKLVARNFPLFFYAIDCLLESATSTFYHRLQK